MQVAAESYGHAVILNIKGELTEDCLVAFKQAVDHQLAGNGIVDLILNMEQVPFIDSASLECLMDLQDQLAQRMGQVKLTNCDENIRKILEITHLLTYFEVLDTAAEAVKSVRS
ncbi:MAG: STAS domain-containing protein [Phycisphaerae bacterium]|jgi:anti-anti-sigma factor